MFYLPDANHQLPKLASLESSPYLNLKFNSIHCQKLSIHLGKSLHSQLPSLAQLYTNIREDRQQNTGI